MPITPSSKQFSAFTQSTNAKSKPPPASINHLVTQLHNAQFLLSTIPSLSPGHYQYCNIVNVMDELNTKLDNLLLLLEPLVSTIDMTCIQSSCSDSREILEFDENDYRVESSGDVSVANNGINNHDGVGDSDDDLSKQRSAIDALVLKIMTCSKRAGIEKERHGNIRSEKMKGELRSDDWMNEVCGIADRVVGYLKNTAFQDVGLE